MVVTAEYSIDFQTNMSYITGKMAPMTCTGDSSEPKLEDDEWGFCTMKVTGTKDFKNLAQYI